MNVRPATLVAGILVVVVGLAIGGWLAIRTRGPAQQVQRVAVTSSTSTATTHSPHAAPTARPASLATLTPIATPTPIVTPTPAPPATAAPTRTPQALSTAAPAAPTAPVVAAAALQGSWQIDEANVHVGSIVWVGGATHHGNSFELNVHKQSVGGRPAVPCERQTGLYATFAVGVAVQTVPFREVNCNGGVSTGEIHVTSFDGGSLSGSFSQDGANLGTFTARKL